ncbi:hypothetical protein CDV36_010901, partial [Fusarium kuroshium]
MSTTTLPNHNEGESHTTNSVNGTNLGGKGISYEFSDATHSGEMPDGGLRAWLVAAGGACIFFSCLGFANSFGVLQEYYMTHQLRGESADKVAWIGSMSTFIQFAAGAIGGPMFDRFGVRVIRPAALCYIFATMMTSL